LWGICNAAFDRSLSLCLLSVPVSRVEVIKTSMAANPQ
jgi:hypothetical protein